MPFKKGVIHPGAIPFKKGQSGNPKGQPRKVLSRINQELIKDGFSPASSANVIEAYNILINLTEEKIKAIITDGSYPMFLRIVAKEMLSKGGPDMIERMLDRAHGKAIQSAKVEHSGNVLVFSETKTYETKPEADAGA